jgi:tripartite-type tricarboxylate transporter receptor subunit TctC
VAKLHKELTAIQDSPELKKQFAHEATDVVRMSSAEYGTFIADQMAKWGSVLKAGKPQ